MSIFCGRRSAPSNRGEILLRENKLSIFIFLIIYLMRLLYKLLQCQIFLNSKIAYNYFDSYLKETKLIKLFVIKVIELDFILLVDIIFSETAITHRSI